MSKDDFLNELREFAQAAEVFRPISGAMASRFTSSRGTYEGGSTPSSKDGNETSLLSHPSDQSKPKDPAEEAAHLGMYGHMTRSVLPFYPTRLLCKRFGVRPPPNVVVDPTGEEGAEGKKEGKEMVGKKVVERMMMDAAVRRFEDRVAAGATGVDDTSSAQVGESASGGSPAHVSTPRDEETVVNAERNDALEAERPGDAVFRAIFGSDDEDDD
jgi:G patch domain-containing protein 1